MGTTASRSVEAILLNNTRVLIDPQSTMIGGAWQGKTAAGVPCPWDSDSIRFFYDRTCEFKDPFILDIGANTGVYCLLPVVNPRITGCAFEPNPKVYRVLQSNLCLNGLEDHIQTMPAALSHEPGSAILKIPASGAASGLANIGNPKRFDRWEEVCVPTDTLDNVAARRALPGVDLIKVDTEGCELFVLLGGEQIIRQHHPGILIEFEERNTAQFGYHPDKIVELLTSWGYFFLRISKCDAYFYKKNAAVFPLAQGRVTTPSGPAGSGIVSAPNRLRRPAKCEGEESVPHDPRVDSATDGNASQVKAARSSGQPAPQAETPVEHPILLISSCKGPRETGDARYNGGLKLYNLWVKLLRQHGFQAYVVTHDGRHTAWLLEHQPHVSIQEVLRWKQAHLPLKFITGWAEATEFVELADTIYFYDCELKYTSGEHFPILEAMVRNGRIIEFATNSRTQQAWHMSQWKRPVRFINEWCDPDYWYDSPEERVPLRVGFMNEGPHTSEHVAAVETACRKAGIDASFLLIQGDEAHVAQAMRTCDLFLGLNLGKHPLWGEGCPRSPQEALHCGCVVIAYDVLGNREYLLPNFSGLPIPRGNVGEMARQVVRVLSDSNHKERLRQQGLALVRAMFSPETCWPFVRDFLGLRESSHHARLDVGTLPRDTIERLLGAPAYIGEEEIAVLSRYAHTSTRLLEIGAAYGSSSFLLLASSPARARVWSVDPFVQDSQGRFCASARACHDNVTRALEAAGWSGAISKWTLVVADSETACADWRDRGELLDFLFIDGDHCYEAVRRDFESWQHFVAQGGHIVIHDSRRLPDTADHVFNRGWQGPTRLAQELVNDNRLELVEEAFSLSIFKKR
ncbi:MAG: FkbM family methyltransferase [Sedimentisphaerales bacterium]|nr:FkbM family methyltransferase [Sedimentisphaerales bacterium]HNY79296.1 FkbM family methyltransferase [Sedimentisphaerales bacterium]HOC64506.1 FkbM family methyltransferase [Sedimentisphaerales bacterium]HOH63369.1 FkbM family methyltransferase [Sedimentisphaerales bacterium]HPY48553.1 FkbM family methyltransferase [Sedimentisphaerales bacterium]